MARQIALLRGINLGARRRVSMPELRALLTELGYRDVRTLLQSGNVVFESRAAPDRVARRLEREIADGLGVKTEVVVRTRDELADVVAANPLPEAEGDPKRFQVSFLSAAADPALVAEISALELAPERVAFREREIYAWHANGIQHSPLAKLLADKRLGVTATARNWSTVTKLLAMADE